MKFQKNKTRDKEALIVLGIIIVGALLLIVARETPRPLAEALTTFLGG